MANISKYKKSGGLYKDGNIAVSGYEADIKRPATVNEIADIMNSYSSNTTTSVNNSASSAGNQLQGALKAVSGTQDLPAGSNTLTGPELFQVSDMSNYMSNIIGAAMEDGTILDRIVGTFDAAVFAPVRLAAEQVTFFTQKEVELRYKINSQLSMAGQMTLDFRNNIEQASVKMADVGYGFDDVADTLISITKQTGTMASLGSDVLERNRFTIRAAIGDLANVPGFIKNFSDIGIGAESAFKQIEKSFKGSMELGLLGRETVEKVGTNLKYINQYGFKNGVDGLTRMVQKSIEFKMNMDSVFTVANKVMDPEGAVDMAANLQAIGGAIGDLGDPFKMMYNATNDVGAMGDAIIGAASSLATFNKDQGAFEVTGINLRKSKVLAEQFGMTMQELGEMSKRTAERTTAATSLMSRGLNISDKEREFITNIARMDGGKMVIDVSSISEEFGGAQQIALDELTETQVKSLTEYQKQFEKMDTKDIAREQYTTTQNIALNVSALVAMGRLALGKQTGKLGKTLDDVFGKDLESAIRATKDKIMGKSTEAETKKSFGETNKPTSTGVNNTAKQEPLTAINVDNKAEEKIRQIYDTAKNPQNSTVTFIVKNDLPMDRLTNSLINNVDFAGSLIESLNTPGSYTNPFDTGLRMS
jgi:hypothetical protein